MSEFDENKQKSNKPESCSNPPGEYWIVVVLLFVTGMLFIESLKLPGIFQGFTQRTGVLPQAMTTTVLFLLLFITIQMILNRYRQGKIKEILNYLFSKEVLILIFAGTSYGILLKYLHFRITTLIFLWGCMYLFDPKQPLYKLIISIAVLMSIIFIFSTIFRVLLP